MQTDGAMGMPMTMMGDMFSQGKCVTDRHASKLCHYYDVLSTVTGKGPAYMIGQPAMGGPWGSQSMGEEEETDEEGDPDMGSFVTQSSRVYSPTPYLKEMVEMFKEGDEILKGKKAKKKE